MTKQNLTVHPDGRISKTEYNSVGKRSASVDVDGHRTEYFYNENEDLQTVSFEYDALNRKIRTFYPSGAFDEVGYGKKEIIYRIYSKGKWTDTGHKQPEICRDAIRKESGKSRSFSAPVITEESAILSRSQMISIDPDGIV